jgi:tetratricopeptide (TPR) repeat protein
MPIPAGLLSNRGTALKSLGRSAEAMKAFQDAITAKADDFNAIVNLASLLDDDKQYEEALKAYQ